MYIKKKENNLIFNLDEEKVKGRARDGRGQKYPTPNVEKFFPRHSS
jgi:hypothetical protein